MRTIFPVNRWTVLVLIVASMLLLGVMAIDYATVWTMLMFYLVPVIAVAVLVRGYWWLAMAVVTTVLWYAIRYAAPGPDAMVNGTREAWQQALWISVTARFIPLVLIGFLCSRLRHYSRSPASLNSSHDATGLLSANGLRETLARGNTIQRMRRGPVAMLLLDVDRRVSAYAGQSSEYGALVGAMIGKVVLNHARESDLCARLSPNHFLVIMPSTDQSGATALNAAVQSVLPEIARSFDDSVKFSTLLLTSPTPVENVNAMRAYAENRLVTLKVLGLERHHAEAWSPSKPAPVTAA